MDQLALLTPILTLIFWTFLIFLMMAFGRVRFMKNPQDAANSKDYKDAILKTIKAGGCNCSRANFTGAYFAALKGSNSIPNDWIKKTISAKKVLNQK